MKYGIAIVAMLGLIARAEAQDAMPNPWLCTPIKTAISEFSAATDVETTLSASMAHTMRTMPRGSTEKPDIKAIREGIVGTGWEAWKRDAPVDLQRALKQNRCT